MHNDSTSYNNAPKSTLPSSGRTPEFWGKLTGNSADGSSYAFVEVLPCEPVVVDEATGRKICFADMDEDYRRSGNAREANLIGNLREAVIDIYVRIHEECGNDGEVYYTFQMVFPPYAIAKNYLPTYNKVIDETETKGGAKIDVGRWP